jgi:lipoprotein
MTGRTKRIKAPWNKGKTNGLQIAGFAVSLVSCFILTGITGIVLLVLSALSAGFCMLSSFSLEENGKMKHTFEEAVRAV